MVGVGETNEDTDKDDEEAIREDENRFGTEVGMKAVRGSREEKKK